MQMDKSLSRMKYSDGSGNVFALGIKDSQVFIFNFFSTMQELTNWQGICSKITFLYILYFFHHFLLCHPRAHL